MKNISVEYSAGDLIHQIKYNQLMYVMNMHKCEGANSNTYELEVKYIGAAEELCRTDVGIRFTDWITEEIKEGVTQHYPIIPGVTNENNI